jgi:hypothetical protein
MNGRNDAQKSRKMPSNIADGEAEKAKSMQRMGCRKFAFVDPARARC